MTGHTCVVVESESEDQQAPLAKLPKSRVLHFAPLNTVEDAFNEWQKIQSQVEELGGCKELSKQSRTNFNKRRHLVHRIRMLIEAKPHGLSTEAACRVYTHIQQQGGLSLAELRDAVYHSEPVPDSSAKGEDQLAGMTMTQCRVTKTRSLSPKNRSCHGGRRQCNLS